MADVVFGNEESRGQDVMWVIHGNTEKFIVGVEKGL